MYSRVIVHSSATMSKLPSMAIANCIIFLFLIGPTLPQESIGNSYKFVSNEDSLYYINTWINLFYKLVCAETIASCYWEKLEQKLEQRRFQTIALMLPESMEHMADCT